MNKCKSNNVIYQAVVSSEKNEDMSYIGNTLRIFKNRLYEHRASFLKPIKKKPTNCTQLSNYIWILYENNGKYTIKRKIINKSKANSNQASCAHYATWKDFTQQMLTKANHI